MRVLITGASGRLGETVRRGLEAADLPTEPTYWASPRSAKPGTVSIELANVEALSDAVLAAKPDAVIHLAGITGAACDRDPDMAHRVNVEATAAIAAAAAQAGASRFVFASTAALYGDTSAHPVVENAELAGRSGYARSKREAEERLEEIADGAAAFRVASLRIFNIYGDGFEDSLISRLIASTATSPVSLRGPDDFVRDYVRADDVASAALGCLSAELHGAFVPINIGSGIPTSNAQLVAVLERTRPIYYSVVDGPPSYSWADIGRARSLVGFAPTPLPK
jgi:UDP-glucose 4-epimerase